MYPRAEIVAPRAVNRGSRYVWKESGEAGRGLINYGERKQKKARTMAGRIEARERYGVRITPLESST